MSAPVEYIEGFVADPAAAFTQLWDGLDWVKPGARRIEYWTNSYNQPYTYGFGPGARTYQAQPPHPLVDAISDALEAKLGFRYEGCFLNGYETAQDGLEWHADGDPGIDHAFPIAVVTLGGPREIQFAPMPESQRSKDIDKDKIEQVKLNSGSLLLMRPGMQQEFFHRIPKAGYVAKPRISLTYRKLVAPKAIAA